ncbi:hypothetical protein CL652_00065 [bacterium]|nr:hypothetical protein [bacterium]|tara:strand:- start:7961 stop:8374 length:414 start_codon:yes stop_codon:yes gene_type:complete
MFFDVNIWTVFAGGIAAVVIGFIWYLPAIFGSTWLRLAGIDTADDEDTKNKMPQLVLSAFIAALILSWVMSQFALVWGAVTVGSALELGFWIWLGFMGPILLSSVLWERKHVTYAAINAGYWLVTTLSIAIIVSLWK